MTVRDSAGAVESIRHVVLDPARTAEVEVEVVQHDVPDSAYMMEGVRHDILKGLSRHAVGRE